MNSQSHEIRLSRPNYTRLKGERTVTIWGGVTSAATGIQDTAVPLAAEINNTGGASGVRNLSPTISWNDTDFGVQESETLNDPSLADESTYTEFGAKNYGGSLSQYYPKFYHDNSNELSLAYDMTKDPRTKLDIVERIDGLIRTSEPAASCNCRF